MKLKKNITILLLAAGSLVGAIDVARVAHAHLTGGRAAASVEAPAAVAVR